jgi:dTDP-4-dehydrorhamnose reductase
MPSRNVAIIGRNGQLARELADLSWPADLRPHFLGRGEINLFDMAAVEAILIALRPIAIVNAAAYTAVDLAESEPVLAGALNTDVPAGLAEIAARMGIPLLHVSTDYVFAGAAETPRHEDDATAPVSVYGQTKLAGEQAILTRGANAVILRSAGLFGRHGLNFLKAMIARSRDPQPFSMVADQIHTPTPAAALAAIVQRMTIDLASGRPLPPIIHMAGAQPVSWFDFAGSIFAGLRTVGFAHVPALRPISLAELARPAPRPRYSALDCNLAQSLGYDIPDWQAALPALIPALIGERIAA